MNISWIQDEKVIKNISLIATNYDEEISDLLTQYYTTIGTDGTHLVELNNKFENELEIV